MFYRLVNGFSLASFPMMSDENHCDRDSNIIKNDIQLKWLFKCQLSMILNSKDILWVELKTEIDEWVSWNVAVVAYTMKVGRAANNKYSEWLWVNDSEPWI